MLDVVSKLSELPAQLKRLQLLPASQKSSKTINAKVDVLCPLGVVVYRAKNEMDVLNVLPKTQFRGQLHNVFEPMIQDGFGLEMTILVQKLISGFAIYLLACSQQRKIDPRFLIRVWPDGLFNRVNIAKYD